jgi:hypothetical protein
MTFNIYVRTLIEIFLIAWISSYSEIYNADLSEPNLIWSFCFSICIVIVLHSMILLNIREIWKLRENLRIEDDSYFSEFFNGIKNDSIFRTFTAVNLSRRSALSLWVIVTQPLPDIDAINATNIGAIVGFALIQLVFWIYIVYVKPFELKRDNVKEFINEFMFFVYTWVHIFFSSNIKWSETNGWIYVGAIMCNILLGTLISIVATTRDFIIRKRVQITPVQDGSTIMRQPVYSSNPTLSGIHLVQKSFVEKHSK